MNMPNNLEKFLARRNRALADLDLEYAKEVTGSDNEEILLMALHKARYECVQLDDDLRNFSALWLRQHGYKRDDGSDLLPHGELPP
jgi:hypothetical protein